MTGPASGDNTKVTPEIFERNHKAMQREMERIEREKPRPDPAPRKEPTAK
jgi:hypothetical protein